LAVRAGGQAGTWQMSSGEALFMKASPLFWSERRDFRLCLKRNAIACHLAVTCRQFFRSNARREWPSKNYNQGHRCKQTPYLRAHRFLLFIS
jgi:hypothetical protein